MNKLRTVTLFMAAVSLLFFIGANWFDLNIPSETQRIAELLAGVLVALGILADTGKEPKPLTKQGIVEKLKSPVAVGAIYALTAYVMMQNMQTEQADVILKMLDSIVVALLGFSVYNNPNNAEAVR